MYNSLKEALEERANLIAQIQSIDSQLSERGAQVVGRVPDDEYRSYRLWKSKAVQAKRHLTLRLQRTKMWMAESRAEQSRIRIATRGGSADALLSELYGLVKSLAAEGVEITQEEQLLMDDIAQFLNE